MKRPLATGVSCWIALLLAGCGTPRSEPATSGPLPVFAGIPPLAYLVEQIGKEHVKVDVLVQPGQDPHTFEPTPRQILALGRAAIFFKIDMPFETVLLGRIQADNERIQVVDATRGIEKRTLAGSCCATSTDHEHQTEHSPERGQPDPHVWLSPPLLKRMAENVAAALCETDPAHEDEYRRNLDDLLARIDAAHQRAATKLAPYRGRVFYVFHPGFGYFADAYGLREEAVEFNGQAPAAKQLRTLVAHARADGITTIFVQPQFAPQSAEAVAKAIGGNVASLNGLDKDVIADLEDIAAKVETAFRESSLAK